MGILCTLLNLYLLAVFAFIILSWFPLNPSGPVYRIYTFLRAIVDPVLAPLRRVLPRLGPLDISPIILILGIGILEGVLGCGGGFLVVKGGRGPSPLEIPHRGGAGLRPAPRAPRRRSRLRAISGATPPHPRRALCARAT